MSATYYRVLLFAFSAVLCAASPAFSAKDDNGWEETPGDQLDVAAITPRAQTVLSNLGIDWQHAQTPHFAIHYEQAIYARKVARMAEFFYDYISQDLQAQQDLVEGRSHIFVFRSDKRWQQYAEIMPDVPKWTFSQVVGTAMFLQEGESSTMSGEVLAHEMTHLIVNRFLEQPPPLWLNEGLAEYYGAFGYSAFKGIKKSKRAQFPPLSRIVGANELVSATAYPQNSDDVYAFYQTAKYMVGWLLLEHPPEQFYPFLQDVTKGTNALDAFTTHYNLSTLDDIDKEFRKFAR
jgi:hypothetical protein